MLNFKEEAILTYFVKALCRLTNRLFGEHSSLSTEEFLSSHLLPAFAKLLVKIFGKISLFLVFALIIAPSSWFVNSFFQVFSKNLFITYAWRPYTKKGQKSISLLNPRLTLGEIYGTMTVEKGAILYGSRIRS